jgi:hypothetical protein
VNPLAFRFNRSVGVTLAVACLTLLLCTPALAARGARRAAKQRPAATAQVQSANATVLPTTAIPPATPGMVVSIEPETGRLVVPSAEEMRLLTAAERTGLLRTSAGLTEIRGPDGAIGVDLQGRFMEFTVVQIDLGGRLHFRGVNETPALLHLLDPRTPAPTPSCEER